MEQNELIHYGVKGMKWGRRKAAKYAKETAAYRNVLGNNKR